MTKRSKPQNKKRKSKKKSRKKTLKIKLMNHQALKARKSKQTKLYRKDQQDLKEIVKKNERQAKKKSWIKSTTSLRSL
jgi:hypothetical protein